jgi:hypothetical protein
VVSSGSTWREIVVTVAEERERVRVVFCSSLSSSKRKQDENNKSMIGRNFLISIKVSSVIDENFYH